MKIHSKHSKRWSAGWVAAAALALLAGPAIADQQTPYSNASDASANLYSSSNEYAGKQMRSESPRRSFARSISDAWINAKVKFRLIRKPGIAPLAINVDTRNSIVTLFGSLSTEDGKREAGRQAIKVAGVKDVKNELQVVPKVAANQVEKRDDQIRNSVEKRIEERASLNGDKIDVEVANGVVRLTGRVDRPGDRMTALSLARNTQGVRSVFDDLRVENKG